MDAVTSLEGRRDTTITNIIAFALIGWGEERIDSGAASVLNSTMPLFTAVFAAAIVAEERLTVAVVVGLALGFIGVIVLTGDRALHISNSDVIGEFAVIAVLWSRRGTCARFCAAAIPSL